MGESVVAFGCFFSALYLYDFRLHLRKLLYYYAHVRRF